MNTSALSGGRIPRLSIGTEGSAFRTLPDLAVCFSSPGCSSVSFTKLVNLSNHCSESRKQLKQINQTERVGSWSETQVITGACDCFLTCACVRVCFWGGELGKAAGAVSWQWLVGSMNLWDLTPPPGKQRQPRIAGHLASIIENCSCRNKTFTRWVTINVRRVMCEEQKTDTKGRLNWVLLFEITHPLGDALKLHGPSRSLQLYAALGHLKNG